MGKRKNKEDPEYIKKKIRRLQKKLERRSTSPPSTPPPTTSTRAPPPSSPPASIPQIPQVQQEIADIDLTGDEELPEEMLLALGSEGEEKTEVGEPIRAELSDRWSKIMNEGLGKEARDNLVKKYPIPNNFPRAVAPIMNAEIMVTLSEVSAKRDRRILYRQNLTGKLMTCLGKSLTNILRGNLNSKLLVEEINDAAKLAADIFHQDTSSRKFFALAGASKTVQEAVKNTKPDNFIFGANCQEQIKAAQAVQKTGATLKEKKQVRPVAIHTNSTHKKQGNWRGPPQYQHHQYQPRGGHQQQYRRPQPRFEQPAYRGKRQPPSKPRSRYQNQR